MASSSSPGPSPLSTVGSPALWTSVLLTSLSTLRSVSYSMVTFLFYSVAYLVRALAWTLAGMYATAAWPLSRLLGFIRFALSPITCIIAFATSPVVYFFRLVGQFKPLYTYLGSAAVIGAIVGLVVALASNYFVVALRLGPDSGSDAFEGSEVQGRPRPSNSATLSQASIKPPTEGSAPPGDDVWLWLEEFKPQKPNAGAAVRPSRKQKHNPSGLLPLALMEEESTE